MTGQVVGRLRVECKAAPAKDGAIQWQCVCACGAIVKARGKDMRKGHVKSCGCLRAETIAEVRKTHGQTNSPEYSSWLHMRRRCVRVDEPAYENYGGRGIAVCERWQSFENFLADMGPKPTPKHSIERLDNEKNYSLDNCVWATRTEQNCNTRRNVYIEIGGERLAVSAAARKFNIPVTRLRTRLRRGWPVARALGVETAP
jgi:hypothetical protein